MIWRDHVISGTNRQRRIGGSWRQRGLVGAIALILAIVAAGVYLFLPPLPTDMRLPRTDLRLAVWLGVTWSNDAHRPSEIRALAAELQSQRVSDLFIYVSYLKADGYFNPTYGHAAEFVRQMRSLAPEMRLLAWIGVPTTPSAANDDTIASRLHDAGIRQAIADFSSFAVTDLGFDGVHLNIEPVTNDDPAFLDTLTDVRGSLPADAWLSTTAHPLRLDSTRTALPYPTVAHHWSPDYFKRVAERSDQIALMAYDSGLPFPRDYVNWLTYQAEKSAAALEDTPGELIIGLPTSEEWTPSHQTQAESLRVALAGLRAGISDRIDGIAIYPYWETDDQEWRLIADSLGD